MSFWLSSAAEKYDLRDTTISFSLQPILEKRVKTLHVIFPAKYTETRTGHLEHFGVENVVATTLVKNKNNNNMYPYHQPTKHGVL